MTAQLVHDLELPLLHTIGLERLDAIAAIEEARSQHWLAKTEMGYCVTRLEDVTAILRDKRFHSALSLLPQMSGLPELLRRPRRRRESILSMEGDEHARLRRLVAPAFTPASANRLRPTMRAVITDLIDRVARRRVRVRRRRLRAVPHPHHLRAAGRTARGLEALLVVGHRHLPHLQRHAGARTSRSSSGRPSSSRPT